MNTAKLEIKILVDKQDKKEETSLTIMPLGQP